MALSNSNVVAEALILVPRLDYQYLNAVLCTLILAYLNVSTFLCIVTKYNTLFLDVLLIDRTTLMQEK
jgi:hypothetical protein